MVCDWGNYSDLIVAVATVFIAIMTVIFNVKLSSIQNYQIKQADRGIIERIFKEQQEAFEIFKYLEQPFSDRNISLKLMDAMNIATLYDLDHISLHLKKLFDVYEKGFEIHKSRWKKGIPVHFSPEESEEIIKRISKLNEEMSIFFEEVSCYRNCLKVNHDL